MSTNEKSATVIRLKLSLYCMHPGLCVSHCIAKGWCSKYKGKHHSSVYGNRVHSTLSNSIPQHSTPVSSQPPSHTNFNEPIVAHDDVVSVMETSPSAESTSSSVSTNCALLLNTDAINIQSTAPFPTVL